MMIPLAELRAALEEAQTLATLTSELCDCVDNVADDIGGSRPFGEIIRDIGRIVIPVRDGTAEALTLLSRLEAEGWQPPEGWVLVPVEPTEEMIKASAVFVPNSYSEDGPYLRAKAFWGAMLAATPRLEAEGWQDQEFSARPAQIRYEETTFSSAPQEDRKRPSDYAAGGRLGERG